MLYITIYNIDIPGVCIYYIAMFVFVLPSRGTNKPKRAVFVSVFLLSPIMSLHATDSNFNITAMGPPIEQLTALKGKIYLITFTLYFVQIY